MAATHDHDLSKSQLQLVEAGDVTATWQLGSDMHAGRTNAPEDTPYTAKSLLESAYSQLGSMELTKQAARAVAGEGLFSLGGIFLSEQHLDAAKAAFEAGARLSDIGCLYSLLWLAQSGADYENVVTPEVDVLMAAAIYTQWPTAPAALPDITEEEAAAAHDGEAGGASDNGGSLAFRLGKACLRGVEGAPRDEAQALVWFKAAAATEHAHAVVLAGWMQRRSRGRPSGATREAELEESKAFLHTAAGGSPRIPAACLLYAEALMEGEDMRGGTTWLFRACESGYRPGFDWVQEMIARGELPAKGMPPLQAFPALADIKTVPYVQA